MSLRDERAAQRKGVRGEAAVPLLLGANVGDVKAAQALLLQLGSDRRPRSSPATISVTALVKYAPSSSADVVLDDRRPASGAGDDEVARVNAHGRASRGDEQQMDRLLDHAPGGEHDGRRRPRECGVERREARCERLGIAGEQGSSAIAGRSASACARLPTSAPLG